MAKLLLEHGANPNLGSPPPLFWAAQNGHLEVVGTLLLSGADPTLARPGTALETTLNKKGHKKVVERLEAAVAQKSLLDRRKPR